MRLFRSPHPAAMFAAWFLVVFNVLFPKGGFKLGELPVTWGYLFLALSAPPLLLYRLLALPLRYRETVYWAVLCLLPMQMIFLYSGMQFGVAEMSFSFSSFVNLFILPWLFLLLYPSFLPFLDGVRLSRWLRCCILLAAIWGIFLFVWHPLTGKFVEVPYLTVNAADYGHLEYTKDISRGSLFKLISTYNNGNLYGVATLILMPVYELLEPVRWRRLTVKLALVLTLSRTVWFGMVLYEALPLLPMFGRQIATFPIVKLGGARRRLLALGLSAAAILTGLLLMSANVSFLFDPTGGGRAGMVAALYTSGFWPARPLEGFSETVYFSAAHLFGYVGLLAFTLIMASPVLLLVIDRSALVSPTRRAALKGVVLYACVAAIDGGFDFLPMMLFYWFAYMIYLYGWPGEAAALAVARRRVGSKLHTPTAVPAAIHSV